MFKFHKILYLSVIAASLCAAGCSRNESGFVSDGVEYIMFADSVGTYPVIMNETFKVPVVSTVARDYDRTFAVEVIDKGSNAIENLHYRLKSNTIVIPAGKLRTDIEVEGIYENIGDTDSLGFRLRLVIPEENEMPIAGSGKKFGLETDCVLLKVCPFDINAFSGYCLVASTYLMNYSLDGSYQKLIWTEPHETLKNTIVCHDWLYDGYDVNLTLEPEDPTYPTVSVAKGQVIGDEWTAFGIIRGDNKIRVESSGVYPSFIYGCQNYITVAYRVYVSALGGEYGTVGHFYNVMEWISAEEAERLMREEGLKMATRPSDVQFR